MHKTGPNPLSPYRYQKSPVPLETSEQMLQKALDSEIHGSIYDKEQTYWIEKNRKDIVVIKKEIETLKEFDKDVYTKEECNNKFVAQETGKGLSSNDFTDELKEKLESLEPLEAEQSDWAENDNTKASYVNNRTHWKEEEHVYNTLYDHKNNAFLTVPEFIQKLQEGELDELEYFMPETDGTNHIELCYFEEEVKPIMFTASKVDGVKHFQLEFYKNYPDTDGKVIIGSDTEPLLVLQDALIRIRQMMFNEEGTEYEFSEDLTSGSYNFEDNGWNFETYHKLDKAYLPDDIGVEGLTDEEIIELINE